MSMYFCPKCGSHYFWLYPMLEEDAISYSGMWKIVCLSCTKSFTEKSSKAALDNFYYFQPRSFNDFFCGDV